MRLLLVLIAVGVFGLAASAQDRKDDVERLKAENVELRQEVRQLRQDLDEIKALLAEIKATAAKDKAVGPPPDKAPPPPPEKAAAAAAPAAPKAEKPPVSSKYKVDLYGYFKLDASWDTQRVNTGNFARWVETENTNRDDGECNITANDTRLGLDFSGPDVKGMKTTAKFEMDFYGGGTENKPVPMMRHAYFQVEWPKYDVSLLAGQTWDVISPLFPTTINYSPAWWSGNIGYRHPQVRLTKGFKLGEKSKVVFQGAMSRTIGVASTFSPGDVGEDSPVPTFQGRAALQFPGLGGNVVIGVSGHRGRNEIDINDRGDFVTAPTWSGNLDITIPLGKKLALKGEFYRGANLDDYLGGIGQGLNVKTNRPIGDTGGWVSLAMGPWKKWRFNLGAAIDDPNDFDLNAGDRTLNEFYFGNSIVNLNDAVSIGFELSRWHTGYKQKLSGDATRFQTSFIYRF